MLKTCKRLGVGGVRTAHLSAAAAPGQPEIVPIPVTMKDVYDAREYTSYFSKLYMHRNSPHYLCNANTTIINTPAMF